MAGDPFTLTPAEQAALGKLRQDRPEMMAPLSAWLVDALDDLAETSQGRVVTEAEADDLLLRLRDEAVSGMIAEMEPWAERENLRKPVVDLLVRDVLAGAREGFVRRVVRATRN